METDDASSEDSLKCFNCGRKGAHISKYCPEEPNFERCNMCQKKVTTIDDHKVWCLNKSFRSTRIVESAMTFEPIVLATFKLMFVRDVKHISKIYHTEHQLPSMLPTKNVFVTMDNENLVKILSYPDLNKQRASDHVNVTLFQGDMIRGYLHFNIDKGVQINQTIRITPAGISEGQFNEVARDMTVRLKLDIVRCSSKFLLNIFVFGRCYNFAFERDANVRIID